VLERVLPTHHADLGLAVYRRNNQVTHLEISSLGEQLEEINNTGVVVRSYTSEMKPGERKKLLADFTKGDIHL